MAKSIGHVLTNETPLPYRQHKPPCNASGTQAIQVRMESIKRLPAPSRGLAFAHHGAHGGICLRSQLSSPADLQLPATYHLPPGGTAGAEPSANQRRRVRGSSLSRLL